MSENVNSGRTAHLRFSSLEWIIGTVDRQCQHELKVTSVSTATFIKHKTENKYAQAWEKWRAEAFLLLKNEFKSCTILVHDLCMARFLTYFLAFFIILYDVYSIHVKLAAVKENQVISPEQSFGNILHIQYIPTIHIQTQQSECYSFTHKPSLI